jgi:NAD(P)-dependent dehydrogenase (short-subunit alcohol dehydrogenase family)
MLVENQNAIICGAGGSIGGAVAKAFAGEAATVSLPGGPPRSLTRWLVDQFDAW